MSSDVASPRKVILVCVASLAFGYLSSDALGGGVVSPAPPPCPTPAHRAAEPPPASTTTAQPPSSSGAWVAPDTVRKTFTGVLQTLFPIKPPKDAPRHVAVAGEAAKPPPSDPPVDGVHIKDCSSAVDGKVTVTVPEGKVLKVNPGLLKEVLRSWYGLNNNRRHDTTGLVDAFVEEAGLDVAVESSVLGGTVGAKGENKLLVEFACSPDAGKLPERLLRFSKEESDFVSGTLKRWKEEDDAFRPTFESDPLSACAYKDDLLRMKDGSEMPEECISPTGDKAACLSKFYAGVEAYAQRVTTMPISHHRAIRCMLAPFALPRKGEGYGDSNGKKPTYSVKQLSHYARHHHTVWLLRVKGRKVEWDSAGKPNGWKHEMQTFSLFQMAVYRVQKVVEADANGFFERNKERAVYLLINALDNPMIGPSPFPEEWTAPPAARAQRLRSAHQGENMPSTQFVNDWTQWGAQALFSTTKDLYPVMSWSTVPGWHRDVIAPNLHPGSCHKFFFDPMMSATPWEQKDDTVLFRAFSVSCDPKSNGTRQRLSCFADKHRDLDIGGTKVKLDIGGGRGWGPTGSQKYMRPSRQAKHKYVLLLDGVVAAFRSTWLLQSGSVILATGVWKDVRTQLLKPWIHYIPFSADLHDFEDALSVVVKNQTYAKWVANNAYRASLIISGHTTEHGAPFDGHYFDTLMPLVSEVTPVSPEGDQEARWTSDHNCKDWLTTTGRIRQCLPDTFPCSASELPPPSKKVNGNYFSGSG